MCTANVRPRATASTSGSRSGRAVPVPATTDLRALYVAPDVRLSDCHQHEALPGSRSLGGGGTGTSSEPATPLQRPLDVHDARPRFEASGQAATEALYGRIDQDVDQVTIHLDDGRSLTASLDDRHYLGWWPITCSGPLIDRGCTPTVSEVEGTDNDGRVLDRWVPDDSDSHTLVPANPAQPEP